LPERLRRNERIVGGGEPASQGKDSAMPYMTTFLTYKQDERTKTALRLRRLRRRLRRRDEALRREHEAVSASDRANVEKDRALAAVCHDLRTPLNAMLGWAQLARSRQLGGVELDEVLSRIEDSGRLQAQLINDILDLAKSASGTLRIERRQVDLDSVARAALASVEPMAAGKGIHVEFTAAAAPAVILGDPVRLQQVAWNLLTNALKFTPAGGRVAGGTAVVLRVRDTGCGISEAFLPHVFEQFRQGAAGNGRHAPGAGLGLAIVHRLVGLHGGTVAAESAGEGRGTTFTTSFPKLAAEAGPAGY
jgi:signal transduction histidine kinase